MSASNTKISSLGKIGEQTRQHCPQHTRQRIPGASKLFANAGTRCLPMPGLSSSNLRSKSTSTESTTVERRGKDSLSRPMWRRRLPLLCGAVIKSSCTGEGSRSTSLNGASSAPSLRRQILQGFDTQMVSFSSRECRFMCYSTKKTHTATSRRRRRELSGIAESIVAGMLADGSISSSLRWMDYLH